ncbi:MAG: DNA mismatch repair endonuclease MutL [Desulfuromonadaceae bacterium]|nr:DNA mismatch repair endonuclease MutL [Desulfuromonadaceae bacterium]
MAGAIHILSETLCNQIAAGEVVERPASVVKELVENSLDADAGQVVVTVENGGKSLIRVEDDGIGMGRDDLFLSLERHATSKLADEKDLFRLRTLGFRGEALPSIAAVSRMVLQSRMKDSMAGLALHLEGGEIKKTLAAGIPPGTSVEIRNLFFNIPARKKFLKTDATEFAHIADFLFRIALSFPAVRFLLHHNGRTILNLARQQELSHRVRELLGGEVFGAMTAIRRTVGDLELEGFAGSSDLHRATAAAIYTYVNRRFVRDRLIQHAVMEGYRNLLPRQRYPVAVIFLRLPPDQVDVNVHPAKREVRFRRQREVHDFIAETLTGAGRREPAATWLSGREEGDRQPAATFSTGEVPAEGPCGGPDDRIGEPFSTLAFETPAEYGALAPAAASPPRETSPSLPCGPDREAVLQGVFSFMRILGQYRRSYIVCQDGDELVLVDQHAAHERIGFERLKAQFRERGVEKQELLLPLVLDLEFNEATALEEHLEELGRLGFDVESYGNRSCVVRAVPALLDQEKVQTVLRDVLEELADLETGSSLDDALDKVFIRMACHGMVRANQALTVEEMKALLADMDSIDLNSHCPHGRPVMIRFSLGEIEGMFLRR